MMSARRWLASLSAAALAVIAAVMALVLPAAMAPAAAAPAAGTRVGAHDPVMILAVGVPHRVSADQHQGRPAPEGQIAAGASVAAEETAGGVGASADGLKVIQSSGRTFVGTSSGTVYDIPKGWAARIADNGCACPMGRGS